jgi:hypothetical protein
VNSFILASAVLLVFAGVTVASIAVASIAERTPRRGRLFFRLIAAMIESRQREAQRVIDRYGAIDGRRARAGSRRPDQVGASSQTAGFNESVYPTSNRVIRPFKTVPISSQDSCDALH